MRSTPGMRRLPRRSRTSVSTRFLNASTSPKAAMSMATMACPVLVAGIVVVEVDDVLPHGGAVQRSGEQANQQREAVALIAADGQKGSLAGAPGSVSARPSRSII